MELKELQVKTRQMAGGPTPKALRRQGFVPAIVYGHKNDPLPLAVDDHTFRLLLKDAGQQALLSLVIDDGAASKTVMLKELQQHPVSLKLIHADFHEVDLTKKITTYVPVATTGVCKGEKEGGVLQLIRRELEVRCLPGLIPESIAIDISALDIGDSVHVADIEAPEGVELVHEVNFTVIAVAAPTKETVEDEEAEEAAAEGAEETGETGETEEGGDE
ncbi:50S ribosomal protein L25 [Desulfosudis oleivorans]|uniref:Large ribosomal subunit protein bL25 n=1 Tax=Desulfosudis oleivorans (strain DSM 6200 / JCM 39069 / Hxd3) TaxID=96561 RepID=RL25_DESOH|nr:50S ribosomal protein L25 [Desulfosudis oleivorans]A8ZXZ4.1 RecName: Full=Large ribosomal subunit protein bL25; AltName: Full=50S ribosomal protein L25; AltName: Full=General stress protein CTC [Desulfosudis oleivorans Hxd3]ABW68621.1 ribosomal 5S rRNA E-loop binding protein Ctc/L25/TL5 [Desulfosudis oleivorans Hxd3]